jgi:sortase B
MSIVGGQSQKPICDRDIFPISFLKRGARKQPDLRTIIKKEKRKDETILKRILLLLLVIVILMSGCSERGGNPSSDREGGSSGSSSSESDIPPIGPDIKVRLEEGEPISKITPRLQNDVADKEGDNSDTIGWLQVPGTPIDDVVVQREGDLYNEYYLRLNFDQQPEFNGVYFADSRASIGDGTREGLGVNTCIYGHAIADEKADSRYGIRFGPLHNYRDPDFARENPYIFFSTEEEDMAFEVVAVFTANVNNPDMPYNSNFETGAEFLAVVEDEILPRSKYNYNAELSEDDKFLTLSTCIYTLDDGTVAPYPDTAYRYAIMARLLDENEPMKAEADFTENDDVVVDPDGAWVS